MIRRHGVTRCGAALVMICALLLPAIVHVDAAAAATAINGGGSGFAGLEISQWTKDTARAPYNLSVNYSAQGSGVGRGNFSNNLFDYGASDIIYPPASEQAVLDSTSRCGKPLSTCFKYVPVSAGGLGFMYNLVDSSNNRIRDLKLTRSEVCKIFTGQIRQWNAPELVATNPQLSAISDRITVVARQDSAGESYVLSEFCIAVAPVVWNAFKAFIVPREGGQYVSDPGLAAGQPISIWPTALSDAMGGTYAEAVAPGSDGVANDVADPNNGKSSITYTAAGYAKIRDLPVASVENAVGVPTPPTETNVTVALAYAKGRGDGTFILDFSGSDPRAYFPSTYSYVLAQTTGFNAGKAATLAQFLCYAVGAGQVIAPSLAYARLSSEIVAISVAAINQIPSGGACVLTGPPPPAPISVSPGGGAKTSAGGNTKSSGSSGTTGIGGTATSTTSTTAVGTPVPVDGQNSPGVAVGPGSPVTLNSVPVSSSSGPTNTEALWALIEGAAVCAIGLVLAGARRGST